MVLFDSRVFILLQRVRSTYTIHINIRFGTRIDDRHRHVTHARRSITKSFAIRSNASTLTSASIPVATTRRAHRAFSRAAGVHSPHLSLAAKTSRHRDYNPHTRSAPTRLAQPLRSRRQQVDPPNLTIDVRVLVRERDEKNGWKSLPRRVKRRRAAQKTRENRRNRDTLDEGSAISAQMSNRADDKDGRHVGSGAASK